MPIALRIVVSSLFVVGLMGLLLFLPAGTFDYWQAWVLIVIFMVGSLASTIYLYVKDPVALARRFQVGRERRPAQRVAVTGVFLLFLGLPLFSAFDHRFGWSPVPAWVSLLGDALVALGMLLMVIVIDQNRYAAGNVTVEEGQQVATGGLYRFVRHPMYSGALLLVLGLPLALDSWWGIGAVVLIALVLALRILDEEKLLAEELDGYREYMQQTRFRLVPYVW